MPSRIGNTCIDCADPWPLAEFWSQVLDLPIHPENKPGDDEVGIPVRGDDEFLFLRVPEPKRVKNRMHVCLVPDQPREAEVERVLALGASMFDDRRQPDGSGWAVLTDPEGNEFCILRSDAERAAAEG